MEEDPPPATSDKSGILTMILINRNRKRSSEPPFSPTDGFLRERPSPAQRGRSAGPRTETRPLRGPNAGDNVILTWYTFSTVGTAPREQEKSECGEEEEEE